MKAEVHPHLIMRSWYVQAYTSILSRHTGCSDGISMTSRLWCMCQHDLAQLSEGGTKG